MDFLLDPNVAYLILLGAVLLAMMSLAAPGTGLFEIGAFFCILLGLSIVPFVYALQKPKRELYVVLSILLLVVGSVFIFPRTENQAVVNPLVAIVASALVAGFLWIAVRKSVDAAGIRPSHDLDRLIGKIGEARTKVEEEGSVQVDGELWTARSEKTIPVGSSIRVLRRDGFVLIVEKHS